MDVINENVHYAYVKSKGTCKVRGHCPPSDKSEGALAHPAPPVPTPLSVHVLDQPRVGLSLSLIKVKLF